MTQDDDVPTLEQQERELALDRLGPDHAVTGGSFPIQVRHVGVVAAVAASGLASMEDHDLVVAGIRHHLAETAQA